MIGRRGFLGATGAFAAAAVRGDVRPPETQDIGEERMRFGVLSDVHITDRRQQPYFEKTLRQLDAWKVDAVLACGDLADYGLKQQLELVAETWFKVFPGGKGSDGRKVVNLMHYGDHDMSVAYIDRDDAKALVPDDALRHASTIFEGDRKAIWEECFKEPWEPIAVKTVKGLPFVLYHFSHGTPDNKYGQNVPGLKEVLEKLEYDPSLPVFFSQHRVPLNTAGGKYLYGQDDGDTTRLFAKYPNLVAFCGHAHLSASEEMAIWQGSFTCIQVPSLRYCTTQCGRENAYSLIDRPPIPPYQMMPQHRGSGHTHQGMMCTVGTKGFSIRRWDFEEGRMLGPDWVVPFSSFSQKPEERPFAFENRARSLKPVEFASGAEKKLKVEFTKGTDRGGNKRDFFTVSFPPAVKGLERANDYEVSVELKKGYVERCLVSKQVYSSRYMYGVESDVLPVTCNFASEEVPPGWLIRFVARPMTTFGVKGEAISTPWEFRAWGKTAKEAEAIARELNRPSGPKKKEKTSA